MYMHTYILKHNHFFNSQTVSAYFFYFLYLHRIFSKENFRILVDTIYLYLILEFFSDFRFSFMGYEQWTNGMTFCHATVSEKLLFLLDSQLLSLWIPSSNYSIWSFMTPVIWANDFVLSFSYMIHMRGSLESRILHSALGVYFFLYKWW